jgi:hypothetical protein
MQLLHRLSRDPELFVENSVYSCTLHWFRIGGVAIFFYPEQISRLPDRVPARKKKPSRLGRPLRLGQRAYRTLSILVRMYSYTLSSKLAKTLSEPIVFSGFITHSLVAKVSNSRKIS